MTRNSFVAEVPFNCNKDLFNFKITVKFEVKSVLFGECQQAYCNKFGFKVIHK